jgi:hypothetical protein
VGALDCAEDFKMRVFTTSFVLVWLAGMGAAQTPVNPSGGNLAQMMRGIFFPSANVVFDVQGRDPGAPPARFGNVGATATVTYSNIYSGWQTLEAAAVALEEASDLLLKPGRLCENGRPVPVERADWTRFTQGMRQAGRAALQAARAKNRDAAIDVTNQIAEACANCHEVYRDKPDVKNRCIP